jgi:hypothetical protein
MTVDQQAAYESKLPSRYLYLPDDHDNIRFKVTLSISDLNRLSLPDSGMLAISLSSDVFISPIFHVFLQFLVSGFSNVVQFVSLFMFLCPRFACPFHLTRRCW